MAKHHPSIATGLNLPRLTTSRICLHGNGSSMVGHGQELYHDSSSIVRPGKRPTRYSNASRFRFCRNVARRECFTHYAYRIRATGHSDDSNWYHGNARTSGIVPGAIVGHSVGNWVPPMPQACWASKISLLFVITVVACTQPRLVLAPCWPLG